MPTAWLGAGGDSPTPEQGIATRWKWGRGEKFGAQCLYRSIVFCVLACLLGPLRCGSALLFRVFFVALTLSFVFLFGCLGLSFFLVLLPLFLLSAVVVVRIRGGAVLGESRTGGSNQCEYGNPSVEVHGCSNGEAAAAAAIAHPAATGWRGPECDRPRGSPALCCLLLITATSTLAYGQTQSFANDSERPEAGVGMTARR